MLKKLMTAKLTLNNYHSVIWFFLLTFDRCLLGCYRQQFCLSCILIRGDQYPCCKPSSGKVSQLFEPNLDRSTSTFFLIHFPRVFLTATKQNDRDFSTASFFRSKILQKRRRKQTRLSGANEYRFYSENPLCQALPFLHRKKNPN